MIDFNQNDATITLSTSCITNVNHFLSVFVIKDFDNFLKVGKNKPCDKFYTYSLEIYYLNTIVPYLLIK